MSATNATTAAATSSASAPGVVYARRDGRTALEIRGKEMKLSEMTSFDGSSWYAQGQTAVAVSLHGPTVARNEEYDTCVVRVRVQHARGLAPTAGGAERTLYDEKKLEKLTRTDALALESLLESTLHAVFMRERFPRCVLVVDVVVMQDDGSLPAVALNAVMCALLDAGLPCRTTMAAVCVAAVSRDGGVAGMGGSAACEYLLDPTTAEEALGTECCAAASSVAEKADLAPAASTLSSGGPSSSMALLGRTSAQQAQDAYKCVSTGVFVFSNPSCGGGLLAQLVRRVGSGRASGAASGLSVTAYGEMMALAERAAVVLFDFFRQCNVAS